MSQPKSALHPDWRGKKPVVGMVHLPPLPGAPRSRQSLDAVCATAIADAEALIAGGVDGVLMENLGDTPFYPGCVPPATVAAMTAVAVELRRRVRCPLGINVLRNDAVSALAVAVAAGADFIRVNILVGARVTDQGIIEGQAHTLLRERRRLGADSIRILADVDVKHSASLGSLKIEQEVADALNRGGADAVIVSGPGTGAPVDPEHLRRVRTVAARAPVWVGSGVTEEGVSDLLPLLDGMIVGSAVKHAGEIAQPVDPERVRRLMALVR